MIGPHIVQAYSRCGLTMALYEARRVSFCLPQAFEEMALISFRAPLALSIVFWTCSLYVSVGSKVSPRILGFLVIGICVLLIVITGFVALSDIS